MALSKRDKLIKDTVCPGCRNNRYNYPGTCERPGIDAPVTSEKCWEMVNVVYDRSRKEYVCPSNNRRRV